ncbi:acyl-CoA thioesterase [Chitinasiproducens palmae]|uniref:(3S)-malyl-CoA thioesterase n=1 Tax=Chitinasiproducens palmae TaxID=1770053 RepID=A0A1H2PTW2_9BURK|nr:acyl-CoA thioesterase [Chitinasiproducens palmae]SDV50193.1 (3S)-malyl-CoA thioesterase [Chitinasiproducens palmae]
MEGYTTVFTCEMPIRWGDMDAFGHVNNTVYFRYMEQTRIEWLDSHGVANDFPGQGPVIVNASMNFRKQLHYPGTLLGVMSCARPGRSSLDTHFELRRTDDPDTLYADGDARIVWVDYAAGRSVPWPEALRACLPDGEAG